MPLGVPAPSLGHQGPPLGLIGNPLPPRQLRHPFSGRYIEVAKRPFESGLSDARCPDEVFNQVESEEEHDFVRTWVTDRFRFRRGSVFVGLATLLTIMIPEGAESQRLAGNLTGRVVDPVGEAIMGAVVTINSPD